MTIFSVQIESASVHNLSDVSTKPELLDRAAELAARVYQLDRDQVRRQLIAREAIGSTGFGHSIAIPHAKIANLNHCAGLFLRLEQAIEFDAHDSKPVDLIFVLLSPENGGAIHLKALAEISRFLRDDQMVSKLRGADSSDALYALLTGQRGQQAA